MAGSYLLGSSKTESDQIFSWEVVGTRTASPFSLEHCDLILDSRGTLFGTTPNMSLFFRNSTWMEVLVSCADVVGWCVLCFL